MEVQGREKTGYFWGPRIENEGFREALIATLKRSGLFEDVRESLPADYKLYTEIASQQTKGNPVVTSSVTVNYRLMDTRLNKEMWKGSINSEAVSPNAWWSKWKPVEWSRMTYEGAVKENLHELLKRLSQYLAQQ